MRSRPGRPSSDQFRLNLTPLLDVVLQLITFFMMLIHFGTKLEGEDAAIKLPETAAALPGNDLSLERLAVGLDEGGRLTSGETRVAADRGDDWWGEQAAGRRKGQRVIGDEAPELPTLVVVRADKRVAYGKVRKLLEVAQNRGFARFSLVVVRSQTP